jgi:hypothetical protein
MTKPTAPLPPAEEACNIATGPPAGQRKGAAADNLATTVWPEVVLAVAEHQDLRTYLEPMWKATNEIFSTASRIEVYVRQDHEIPDQKNIIFDVQIRGLTSAQYRAAHKAWNMEFLRVHGGPIVHIFYLLLDILD